MFGNLFSERSLVFREMESVFCIVMYNCVMLKNTKNRKVTATYAF